MNYSFIILSVFIIISVSHGQTALSASEQWSVVDLHNSYRAKIANGEIPGFGKASAMPALTWNDKLAQAAQLWANQCSWKHNPSTPSFGENLHAESGVITTWGQSVGTATIPEVISSGIKGWFDEYNDAYQYSDTGKIVQTGGDIGHFTQLIWDKTTQIGCGYAKCANYPPGHYLVCNYYPAGNFNMHIAPVYTLTNGAAGSGCTNGKRSDGLCNGSGGSGTELQPVTPSPTTPSTGTGSSGSSGNSGSSGSGANAKDAYIKNTCGGCYSSSTQCYPCITTVRCCSGASKQFTDSD